MVDVGLVAVGRVLTAPEAVAITWTQTPEEKWGQGCFSKPTLCSARSRIRRASRDDAPHMMGRKGIGLPNMIQTVSTYSPHTRTLALPAVLAFNFLASKGTSWNLVLNRSAVRYNDRNR